MGSLGHLRKTRSKQRNIRRDNRPEEVKAQVALKRLERGESGSGDWWGARPHANTRSSGNALTGEEEVSGKGKKDGASLVANRRAKSGFRSENCDAAVGIPLGPALSKAKQDARVRAQARVSRRREEGLEAPVQENAEEVIAAVPYASVGWSRLEKRFIHPEEGEGGAISSGLIEAVSAIRAKKARRLEKRRDAALSAVASHRMPKSRKRRISKKRKVKKIRSAEDINEPHAPGGQAPPYHVKKKLKQPPVEVPALAAGMQVRVRVDGQTAKVLSVEDDGEVTVLCNGEIRVVSRSDVDL